MLTPHTSSPASWANAANPNGGHDNFDAYDALIMLQIAEHALQAARYQMASVDRSIVQPAMQQGNQREPLDAYIERYMDALKSAEYEGCQMLGHDAGDYFFRLGTTRQHLIMLRHSFDRFLGEREGDLLIPAVPGSETFLSITDLLARKPATLSQVPALVASLDRASYEVRHSLREFTAEMERVERSLT